MANLTPTPGGFSPNVYQLETTDAVLGGPTGNANKQAKQLIANDIALKALVDAASLRTFSDFRAFSAGGSPVTYSVSMNAAVLFWQSGSNELNLVDLTGDTDFAPTPEGIAAGRISWCRIILHETIGLTIHKPVGMVVNYSGLLLSSGDPDDTGATATLWATANSVVDIYINNNLALITSNLPSTSPGFKTGMMVKWGTVAAVIDAIYWKDCDGSAISRTTYAELFAVIGTAYGAGDGTTTFNLPNDPGFMIRHRD